MVETVGFAILRNIGIKKKQLALLHRGVGLGQIGAALAQGFYLGALQGNSCLKGLQDFIFVTAAAVVGHHLDAHLLAGRFCAAAL